MGIFLASLAVLSAWLIYRYSMFAERERIINSLEAFLNVTGEWFASPYPKEMDKEKWFYPGEITHKVNTSIIPSIINSNLISKELSIQLTYFIQLIENFNHLVDNFNDFKYSDIKLLLGAFDIHKEHLENKNYVQCRNFVDGRKEELKKSLKSGDFDCAEPLAIIKYIDYIYILKKLIHIDGIGSMDFFSGRSKFPQLNKCFHEIECILAKEKGYKRGILNDDARYIFGDFLFILLPAGLALSFILKYICLLCR